MTVEALAERRALALSLAAGGMVLLGAAAAAEPVAAVGLVGVAAVAAIAFAAPVAGLLLILFLTAIVPYAVQNRFGVGGGHEAPGVLVSDLLLMFGLLRALLVIPTMRLDRRRLMVGAGLALFVTISFVQLARALELGREASEAGAEFRRLLGFSAFFLALPLLEDPRSRSRLFKGLLALGLMLGLWAMAQWALGLAYSAETGGDIGVREGVAFTSSGRGQVQGGLYGFPVAITLSYAALLSGTIRSLALRALLAAALVLNAAGALLTFERTFWAASILGIAFVTLKARGTQKVKVGLAAPIVLLFAFAALSTFAPSELTTARERLLSLGQYRSDSSLRFRIVESRHVVEQIAAHPVTGSGLAATIHFGRPYEQVLPQTRTFAHNGYLWLAWKAGIPATALLFAVIVVAAASRGRPEGGPVAVAMRDGAQGALLALLLVTVTFPTVNALSITAAMGLLLAMATLPGRAAPTTSSPRAA